MAVPASSRPARQTPWQRADAAFVSLPDSPTGLAPDLQALLRRGWMEALAWRLERRRIEAAMGIESPRPTPQRPLLRRVAERRFYDNMLRWYARGDLWKLMRAEVTLTLDLLEVCVGRLPGNVWIPLLLEECRRISLIYAELRRRIDGEMVEGSLRRLLASLAGKASFSSQK
ncbi:MAG TPA: hypothetical protein VFU32_14895 [Ktedonobacterales bacterium]|nr:hypothetical protein [Ktedonobacterales bacterium]